MLDGVPPIDAARALTAQDLADPTLRAPDVAQAASKVAIIPEVRAALVDFQRSYARRTGGAVLDGRDIGTVICPDAEAKLFVTASPEVRARRRLDEFLAAGVQTDYDTVLRDTRERDLRDSTRADAPLVATESAVIIDTSDMGIEAAIDAAIAAVDDMHAARQG